MERYDVQWLQKDTKKSADDVQAKLDDLHKRENLIGLKTGRYDTEPEWQLSEPTRLMSANTYKTKIVEPFIRKLKDIAHGIVAQYLKLEPTIDGLRNRYKTSSARRG